MCNTFLYVISQETVIGNILGDFNIYFNIIYISMALYYYLFVRIYYIYNYSRFGIHF